MRFITPDDRVIRGGLDAQGYNRYSYVLNNPSKFVDPTGREPVRPPWVEEWEGSPLGTPPGTDGLREMDEAYWQRRFETEPPELPQRVVIPIDVQIIDTLLEGIGLPRA